MPPRGKKRQKNRYSYTSHNSYAHYIKIGAIKPNIVPINIAMCASKELEMKEKYDSSSSIVGQGAPEAQHPPSALDNASFFSRLLWRWPYPLIDLGTQRPLTTLDLPLCSEVDTSKELGDMFDEIFNASTSSGTSLLRSLFFHYVQRTKYTQIILILESTAHILQALALGGLIRHIGDDDSPASSGYLWATAIVGCSIYVMFAHHIYFFATWRLGMQYKNGAIAAIYRKCTRLKSTHSEGGVVQNLATNDVERFFLAAIFLPYLFFGPMEAVGETERRKAGAK